LCDKHGKQSNYMRAERKDSDNYIHGREDLSLLSDKTFAFSDLRTEREWDSISIHFLVQNQIHKL